ncbi:MAG: DNA replication/repair protein RecF [Paracoccaceae bacterium]|nr:DNA replication/repair protein RecF [Paracoccaceae bacterium]
MTARVVTRLALSHVRSHRRTVIEADPRPVAIYGANGAGKTNILEVVSMLSPGRGLRRAAAADLARRPGEVGWKASAEVSGNPPAEIETWAEPGGARQVRVDGKTATQVALARILRVLWLVPAMDRLWTEGADGRRRFLDRMTMSLEPGHGETVLAYEKAMRERNRLLKDEVRDAGWYEALEAQMATAGAALHAARARAVDRVTAAEESGGSAFPVAELALVGPDEVAPPVEEPDIAAALRDGRRRDMAAGRTLVGPHRADLAAFYAAKGAPARDCSTGEQKALLISLVLANARALAEDTGAPPILLLDEVAAHLDADRRAALYNEVLTLGAQAWMTGTGPELFAELGDRTLHLEVTEIEGVSAVHMRTP